MSHRELDRLRVVEAVVERQLTQARAAQQLGLSVRQVKRLARRLRAEGPAGLVSRQRGRPSNNRIEAAVRAEYLALVRTRYPDFGPTFAHEKLVEQHDFRHSVETLRQWMIEDGLWRAKARRYARAYPIRERRPCRGELVQIDGSPHDWFEGRAPRCTLIVFIDDATGELMALRFVRAETTAAYMTILGGYLAEHGRPLCLYSDRHSIFRGVQPGHEGDLTQFGRALKMLDIEAIHARTPQAKGRVERANQTLQDRLIKEMRLAGIGSMADANAWLPGFIDDFNRRFAVTPHHPEDAHRPVLHDETALARILCLHHTRTLSKNLTLQVNNRLYQVHTRTAAHRLRHARVTVCEAFDGTITLLCQGKVLNYSCWSRTPPTPTADSKDLNDQVDQIKRVKTRGRSRKPASNHPWRHLPPISNSSNAASTTS
ncbi:MAG TPA: ISNCY family transposase [Gammaproteobacteria bacterium]|nr:ISNCY family transposase [Gammaproteobacteria bacterium]